MLLPAGEIFQLPCVRMQVDAAARQMDVVMDGGYNGLTSTQNVLQASKGHLVHGFIVSASGMLSTVPDTSLCTSAFCLRRLSFAACNAAIPFHTSSRQERCCFAAACAHIWRCL